MAKMLNRCQPCGRPVLEGQQWVPVGRGRLEHKACCLQTQDVALPRSRVERRNPLATEWSRSRAAEWALRFVQGTSSPGTSVSPASGLGRNTRTRSQGPRSTVLRRVAAFFGAGSRSRRAA